MITRSSCKKLCEGKQSKLHSIRSKPSVKRKKCKGKQGKATGKLSKKDANTIEKPKNYTSANGSEKFVEQQVSKRKQSNKRPRPSKKDVDLIEECPDYSANETKKYAEEHENKRETILRWLEQLDIQNVQSNVDNTVFDTQESSSCTSDLLEELNMKQRSRTRKTDDLGCLRCKHFLDIPRNLLQLPSRRMFSPLTGYNADLSFIQAISWLKSAILTMSNVPSEEFFLIFHKQCANQNTENTKKKVKSMSKNLVNTVDKQKVMCSDSINLESRDMPSGKYSLKSGSVITEVKNISSPVHNSRSMSTGVLLTPQRKYGNCMLNTQVIGESDQGTSNSVTPNTLGYQDNVLSPGFNRGTTWDNYRNSQGSQSNFNVKVNLIRSCPLISNISCKSSPSVQTCASNIWNDVDIELSQGLPTPNFNNLDLVASQLNTSTFQTSESSLEIIQMLGPAFITQCSKISKIAKSSKSSSDAMMDLVEQYPTPSSDNNIKQIIHSVPVCNDMPTKIVETSESLQFDSAYDTCNMHAFDTFVPIEGSTVEKTKNYKFPVQWECKNIQNVIRAESNLNGIPEKNRLESSLTDYVDTLSFRRKQSEVSQIKNKLEDAPIESKKMSQSLLVRSNRYSTNKKSGCINRNIGKIRDNVSAKHTKEQLINEVIEENKEPETTTGIPTQFLNYTLDTLQVNDVLHESVKVIMSVFEKDEIAEMYMKRKRWKGTLEEEAVNAILNLSDILEVERKLGVYNKQIVNVIEKVLTEIFDSTSLNKSSLWTYHIQIILQFCNSMRICIKIIGFLITKLEAFQSMLSASNYKIFRRFNQLHYIFYGLDIVIQKFQSVRSCKLHESCENPIPPVTDLWKRQWTDSVAHDDMDILQVEEKRWMGSLESFAVTYVGEFPQFAEKARQLFLMLIGK